MPWIARDRRRYDLVLRLLGFALSQSPKQIRMFPLNLYLWDLRRRMRSGTPLL
ncbi:hypothetical protein ACQP1G_29980 [Nocardia sp. CA-107356]|uniref:hypothetical protein n=1 Tax=Nocardia sp. CA-107356 TaxID=3239972 RepID=UPI003D89D4A4